MVRSYLGYSPVIPGSCYVDISAQIIGQVELGEHSSVWMNAVSRGDVHSIRWLLEGHPSKARVAVACDGGAESLRRSRERCGIRRR